jgi:hypothetical protein
MILNNEERNQPGLFSLNGRENSTIFLGVISERTSLFSSFFLLFEIWEKQGEINRQKKEGTFAQLNI